MILNIGLKEVQDRGRWVAQATGGGVQSDVLAGLFEEQQGGRCSLGGVSWSTRSGGNVGGKVGRRPHNLLPLRGLWLLLQAKWRIPVGF